MSFTCPGLIELAERLECRGALLRTVAADLYCCSSSTEWLGYAAAAYATEAMGVRQRLLAAAEQTDCAAAAVRAHATAPLLAVGP